jgi:dTDP-4-amino-4,6-dideoxygalactose transaminase
MSSSKIINKPFIIFGKPNISEEEIVAVTDVLKSGWIGTGKVSKEFEDEFVKYMGGGYAVAVSSCTVGLSIALKSLGLCHGDKVVTSPITFCATVNAILNVGATPVFSDVDERGCLDFSKIKENKFEAILPINYTGAQANITKNFNLPILEDAAHSFGGENSGVKQGSIGDLSVFSFYATKNITAGEAGIIYTKSRELADKCRIISNNGQSNAAWSRYSSGPINNYQVLHPGFKGNLPDILAALGLAQLKRWQNLKIKRQRIWKVYESAFGEKEKGHSQHLYTIRVKNRHSVREYLYNKGIGTGIHYEALHLEPAYQYLGYKKGDFPIAEKIGQETLSLPVSNSMTEDDAWRVVETINACRI